MSSHKKGKRGLSRKPQKRRPPHAGGRPRDESGSYDDSPTPVRRPRTLHGCSGKRPLTAQAALAEEARHNKKYAAQPGLHVEAYLCPHLDHSRLGIWHVGKPPRTVKQQRKKLPPDASQT